MYITVLEADNEFSFHHQFCYEVQPSVANITTVMTGNAGAKCITGSCRITLGQ